MDSTKLHDQAEVNARAHEHDEPHQMKRDGLLYADVGGLRDATARAAHFHWPHMPHLHVPHPLQHEEERLRNPEERETRQRRWSWDDDGADIILHV